MKGNGPPPPQPEAVDAAIKSILSADSSDFVSALDRFTWTFGKGDFFHWVRRGGPPALGIAPVCSMRGARACSRIPSLASLPRAQTALFDHLDAWLEEHVGKRRDLKLEFDPGHEDPPFPVVETIAVLRVTGERTSCVRRGQPHAPRSWMPDS